jgi:hypothetical protein
MSSPPLTKEKRNAQQTSCPGGTDPRRWRHWRGRRPKNSTPSERRPRERRPPNLHANHQRTTLSRPLLNEFGLPSEARGFSAAPAAEASPSPGHLISKASLPSSQWSPFYRPAMSRSLRTAARRSAVSRVMVRWPARNRESTERSPPASRARSETDGPAGPIRSRRGPEGGPLPNREKFRRGSRGVTCPGAAACRLRDRAEAPGDRVELIAFSRWRRSVSLACTQATGPVQAGAHTGREPGRAATGVRPRPGVPGRAGPLPPRWVSRPPRRCGRRRRRPARPGRAGRSALWSPGSRVRPGRR